MLYGDKASEAKFIGWGDAMRVRTCKIVQLGDSLALTIPDDLATEAGLRADAVVDLTLIDGKLVVTPQPEPISLESLLAGITPDNLHDEQDFGGPVGKEVW